MTPYEYRCRQCGRLVYASYPMGNAVPEVKCDGCGGPAVRYFGGMSFVLKGDGWPSHSARRSEQMTAKNERAKRLARMNHGLPKQLVRED